MEQVRAEAEAAVAAQAQYRRVTLARVVERVGKAIGVDPASLAGGGRAVPSRAREGVASLWTTVLGRPGPALAGLLGVRPQSIYAAAARGRTARTHWDTIADKLL